jgi:hypothetical protein
MKSKIHSDYVTASIGAVAMFALTTLAADADVGVTVNGSAVDISPPPIVQAGRVFVPLRGVFEQLGASVVYANGAINATGNGRAIALQIGSTQATVNGQPQIIDVAPFIVGESTYVPLRFISESLGDSVSWDDADSIAAIDTGGGPADYYSPGTASYVDTAPPSIPVYDQPDVPDPNYLWQPGYWAWGSYGYYWVPGTWVPAPQPGYLWTPGYWQGTSEGFHWNPGYWALAVGYYGGVNYGGGYYGNGYDGGRWSNNEFRYNTYVSRVNTTNIRNVYVDRNVYANDSSARIGYNGGKYGLRTHPTPQQLSVARQRHLGMTPVQQQHVQIAEQDRRLLATVNHNKPPVLAAARPLSQSNRPAGFVAVKAADRVNPLANVAPVHVPGRRAARPATHAPPAQAARPAAHIQAARPAAHIQAARPAANIQAARPAANIQAARPAAHVQAARPAAHIQPARPATHSPAAHEASTAYHGPAVHEAPVAHAPATTAHQSTAYHAPVVHKAAPVYHAPAVHEAPAAHAAALHPAASVPAPTVRQAPAYHAPVVHEAPPAYHAPVVHEAPPAYHAPVVHEAPPAYHPVVHEAPPAYHAPVVHEAPPVHVPAVYAAPPRPVHAAPAFHAAPPPHAAAAPPSHAAPPPPGKEHTPPR